MTQHLDVFVSSTSVDLREHRQAVREAILDLQLYPIMMENFPAEGVTAVNKCRRAVDDAEIFVGIYAKRYGWIPSAEDGGDGTKSITALEYAWAQERGIPMLCFVLDDTHTWPATSPHVDREPEKAALLADFKAQVRGEAIIVTFTTPDSLRASVVAALVNAVRTLTGEERAVGVWRRPVGPSLEYNFVGRDEDQTALTDLLGAGDQPVTVVSGTGGIGKTFLAKHMAHALKEHFPGGVLWVSMGPDARYPETEVPRVLATWACHHQQGRDLSPDSLTPDFVRGLLADAPGRLIAIFDDVWHPAPVQHLRRALPDGTAVLVTTRLARVAAMGQRYPLERLNDDDARALIEDRLRAATIDPAPLEECITDIVMQLKGHALALDLAARQIVLYWRDNAVRYAERLRKNLGAEKTPFKLLRLSAEEEGTRDDSLEAALFMSYQHLTEDQQAKYRALGVFAPDTTFTSQMVYATWQVNVNDDAALEAAEDALNALVGAGLVRQRDDLPGRYEQHMLLRTYAAALARRADEYYAAFERYARHVVRHIAMQFHTLPLETWDARILTDKDHIHHIGDALAGTEGPDGTLIPGEIQTLVLTDTPLESLAQPDAPENLDVLRREIAGDAAPEDDDGRVRALITLGSDFTAVVTGYVFHRHVAEGRRWLRMGLACARLTGDRKRASLLMGQLGSWHDQRGEKQISLAYQEAGLIIDRALGDRRNEAATLNNIGGVYDDLGEKQRAAEYYEQALALNRELGDRHGEATTLNNMAGIYLATGDPRKALDYLLQILEIDRAIEDRSGEATTLNNIGMVYGSLGDNQRALEYCEQALPIAREVGDRVGEATTLNNIGMAYDAMGEKRRALEYFAQALPITREVGDRSGEATTLNNMGGVYDDLGESERAMDYYEQALPIRRAVGDRVGEATTLNNMAAFYFQQGEHERSADVLRQIIQIFRTIGAVAEEAVVLNNLAVVLHRALGRTEEAIPLQERAIMLLERHSLPQDAGGDTLAAHRAFLAELNGETPSPTAHLSAQEAAIVEAINALLSAQSAADLRAKVESQAGILFPAVADQLLAKAIPQQSDPQTKQALEFVRDLLRMCREVGVDEAFRRLEENGG